MSISITALTISTMTSCMACRSGACSRAQDLCSQTIKLVLDQALHKSSSSWHRRLLVDNCLLPQLP